MLVFKHQGTRYFCSKECSHNSQKNRVSRICPSCSLIFEIPYSIYLKDKFIFCSNKCRGVWMSLQNKETTPHWKGGVTKVIYPKRFYSLRLEVLERDKNSCLYCGESGNCIHHIDYDKNNLNFNNLITLCRKCHAKTNKNRQEWNKIFTEILSTRQLGGFVYI